MKVVSARLSNKFNEKTAKDLVIKEEDEFRKIMGNFGGRKRSNNNSNKIKIASAIQQY
jgi:hypothetical protein